MSETETEQQKQEPEAAEKAKRERATYPIRVLPARDGGGWGDPIDGVQFSTIEQAERWVRDSGEPGRTYMLARVIGGRRMPPRVVEDVAL